MFQQSEQERCQGQSQEDWPNPISAQQAKRQRDSTDDGLLLFYSSGQPQHRSQRDDWGDNLTRENDKQRIQGESQG